MDLEELQIFETKCYEINSNILQTLLNKNITRFHQFELSFQLYYALAKYNILDLEELQILETKCYEVNSYIL